MLGYLLYTAKWVAKQEGLIDGFRIVIKDGPDGCASPARQAPTELASQVMTLSYAGGTNVSVAGNVSLFSDSKRNSLRRGSLKLERGLFETSELAEIFSDKEGVQSIVIMFGWLSFKKKMHHALSIVELQVHMDCEGCRKRVERAVSRIDGVDSIDIDMDQQKVTVTGYVDQRKVLKVVRRTGRKAEFWPYPYDSEYYPYASHYLDESTYSTTYNYYRHGFNESIHGYFPNQAYSTVPDDTVFMFSDDNVHACTIM